MCDRDFDLKLDLLVPWNIPIESQLDLKQQKKITQALTELLRSLKQKSSQEALQIVEQAINNLGIVETKIVEINSTKTPLKDWEVTDYDSYFRINHVETDEPAICLVKGLLINCQAFFLLCQSCNSLDPIKIENQKKGFASYAYLLARNFQLDI